jgi:hypothetical protein
MPPPVLSWSGFGRIQDFGPRTPDRPLAMKISDLECLNRLKPFLIDAALRSNLSRLSGPCLHIGVFTILRRVEVNSADRLSMKSLPQGTAI